MQEFSLPAPVEVAIPDADGSWLLLCYMQDQDTHPYTMFTSIVRVSVNGAVELYRRDGGKYCIFGIDKRTNFPTYIKQSPDTQWCPPE